MRVSITRIRTADGGIREVRQVDTFSPVHREPGESFIFEISGSTALKDITDGTVTLAGVLGNNSVNHDPEKLFAELLRMKAAATRPSSRSAEQQSDDRLKLA
ncbi:MAG: hypothetical protein WAX80_02145 [Minisyncoccia bacterium]